MAKQNNMTKDAQRRVQSGADKNPKSKTAQSGFKERAQRAVDKKSGK